MAVGLPDVKRSRVSQWRQMQVYHWDHFTCRYCGSQTVFEPVLCLVLLAFPTLVPFHPNWRRSETHPLYWESTTSCEHVIPVARGGTSAVDNLITVCARCQYVKGSLLLEEIGWRVRPVDQSNWDGLTQHLKPLFERVRDQSGVPEARTKRICEWLRLFNKSKLPSPADPRPGMMSSS
jgi:hypothetical protein